MDPTLYGPGQSEPRRAGTRTRDLFDILWCAAIDQEGLPCLGICPRHAGDINVALGRGRG